MKKFMCIQLKFFSRTGFQRKKWMKLLNFFFAANNFLIYFHQCDLLCSIHMKWMQIVRRLKFETGSYSLLCQGSYYSIYRLSHVCTTTESFYCFNELFLYFDSLLRRILIDFIVILTHSCSWCCWFCIRICCCWNRVRIVNQWWNKWWYSRPLFQFLL